MCALIDRRFAEVQAILDGFGKLLQREWRPTYLQGNVGTLIPFLVDGVSGGGRLDVPSGALYSSLVFEDRSLRHVRFAGGTFINVGFTHADWEDVTFESCEFGEVAFDRTSRFERVLFKDCRIEGIKILGEEDEIREYAPERILLVLRELGIQLQDGETPQQEVPRDSGERQIGDTRRLVQRLLNVFRRTTFLPESTVKQRFHSDVRRMLDEVLPLMEEYGIVERRAWKGSGKQRAWGLPVNLVDIEKADGDPGSPLHAFWRQVDALDGEAASAVR